ncbi:hypothetical protein A2V68_01030 [candidate division Kazan bacterium RBG_13_50_9]|uniref:EamA domain-containing protein n=1 Tax=candidate division Kazan bacterium RBG_13_50_9 TaxID=1798535 RepID=A0A1F4NTV9_UNCK3|nr:MAG: hypothetical protein A2V68_01030 [candidate division Kazan bacterium RBG_13_50_9]
MSWTVIPWYVFALISAVLVGAKVVFQKTELKREHSLDYVVAASVVAMLVSFFLWPWVRWNSLDGLTIAYTYAASILGSLAIWLGAKALRHLDVSFVAPQSVVTAVFTLLFAYLFLGEVLSSNQWLGAVVMIVSGAILAQGALSFQGTHPFGFPGMLRVGDLFDRRKVLFYELLLLLSMVFIGLSSIFDKIILLRTDVVSFVFVVGIFLFINHVVLYLVVKGDIRQIPAHVENLGWLIVWIAVLTVLARLAYSQALSMTEVSLVIPLKKSSILVSTIWGSQLFREKQLPLRVVVAILMLVGVWLLVS